MSRARRERFSGASSPGGKGKTTGQLMARMRITFTSEPSRYGDHSVVVNIYIDIYIQSRAIMYVHPMRTSVAAPKKMPARVVKNREGTSLKWTVQDSRFDTPDFGKI